MVFPGWYSVAYRFAHTEWQWCFLAGTVSCIDLLTYSGSGVSWLVQCGV